MARFRLLQIPVRAWDEDLSSASEQYAHLADQGLSLGDRACITEASVSGIGIVTADPAWKSIPEISDRVILIR